MIMVPGKRAKMPSEKQQLHPIEKERSMFESVWETSKSLALLVLLDYTFTGYICFKWHNYLDNKSKWVYWFVNV